MTGSEATGNSGEDVHIIRRPGNTQINARIQLNIFAEQINQPEIDRADPRSMRFRAQGAEEFSITGKVADQVMGETDGMDVLGMMAAGFIAMQPLRMTQ